MHKFLATFLDKDVQHRGCYMYLWKLMGIPEAESYVSNVKLRITSFLQGNGVFVSWFIFCCHFDGIMESVLLSLLHKAYVIDYADISWVSSSLSFWCASLFLNLWHGRQDLKTWAPRADHLQTKFVSSNVTLWPVDRVRVPSTSCIFCLVWTISSVIFIWKMNSEWNLCMCVWYNNKECI